MGPRPRGNPFTRYGRDFAIPRFFISESLIVDGSLFARNSIYYVLARFRAPALFEFRMRNGHPLARKSIYLERAIFCASMFLFEWGIVSGISITRNPIDLAANRLRNFTHLLKSGIIRKIATPINLNANPLAYRLSRQLFIIQLRVRSPQGVF